MSRLKSLVTIVLWIAMLAGLSAAVLATPVLTLQQAAEDPDVWVRFTDKSQTHRLTRGYFGDAVGITVANFHDYPIRVTARVGDVLIGKAHKKQNLVVTKPLIIDVTAGGKTQKDGIYTACLDAHEDGPEPGSYFDIGPNISRWANEEAELLARRLLPQINEERIWEEGYAQSAIWKLTDNYLPHDAHAARDLLRRAGIDPDQDCLGFQHLNPSPETPDDAARYFSGPIPMRPIRPGLAVLLTWEESADLDLHIIEPSGEEIYSDHPTSGSGGLLDQTAGCNDWIGEAPVIGNSRGRGEHAYWYAPPYGTYTIEINYRAPCDQGGSTTWHVVIEIGNEKREFSGTIGSGMTVLVDQFTVSHVFIPVEPPGSDHMP